MKKSLPILLVFCLCGALLSGCAEDSGPAAAPMPLEEAAEAVRTPAPNETADPNAPQEYVAEGVGRFYLPQGFTMVPEEVAGPDAPRTVTFVRGNTRVTAYRYGAEYFAAAGTSMPADLEAFAASDLARGAVPQAVGFATDDLGSLFADWIDSDGQSVYYVLKAGDGSFGCVTGVCPEGASDGALIPRWLSQVVLD